MRAPRPVRSRALRLARVMGVGVLLADLAGGGASAAAAGSGLVPRSGGPSSGALDQIERSVTRPLPSVPPPPGPGRTGRVWVPDRHLPAPDGSTVHVPGHWEYRPPAGEYQTPPLLVCSPDGRCTTAPATRTPIPPAQRQAP